MGCGASKDTTKKDDTKQEQKPAAAAPPPAANATMTSFDWITVGGGIAALAAARTVQEFAIMGGQPIPTIGLLEAEADFGGRIRDVYYTPGTNTLTRCSVMGPNAPTGPVVPVGCVRIDPDQSITLNFFEYFCGQNYSADFYQDMMALYPTIPGIIFPPPLPPFDPFTVRCVIKSNDNFPVTPYQFPKTILDQQMFRFVGDFESTDMWRYKEFAQQDVFHTTDLYPKQGFSQMAQACAQAVIGSGGVLQNNAVVQNIEYIPSQSNYVLQVLVNGVNQTYQAKNLVMAVPPLAMAKMTGNVPATLNAQPFVYETKPIPVTTITMWFQDAWWADFGFQRIWDHFSPLLHVELFGDSAKLSSKAIRISYADGSCSEVFGLPQRGNTGQNTQPTPQAIQAMKVALSNIFQNFSNAYTEPVAGLPNPIPDPLYTHLEHFDDAWHFEYPGATVDIFTKQDQAASVNQLSPATIGSSIYLCNEAYNPQRAWIAGSLDSVRRSLSAYIYDKDGKRLPLGKLEKSIWGAPDLPALRKAKVRRATIHPSGNFFDANASDAELAPEINCDEKKAYEEWCAKNKKQ